MSEEPSPKVLVTVLVLPGTVFVVVEVSVVVVIISEHGGLLVRYGS